MNAVAADNGKEASMELGLYVHYLGKREWEREKQLEAG